MTCKVGVDVDACFTLEVETDDPKRAAQQAIDQVDKINARLKDAGVTWLSVELREYGDVSVTDETGKCHCFEVNGDYEEDEDEEEEEE